MSRRPGRPRHGAERLAGGRARVVSVTHVSNALGTINDVRRIAEMAEYEDKK